MSDCKCSETLLSDGSRFVGEGHDCEYVAKRNELIGTASASAYLATGQQEGPKFTAEFVRQMDRLASERGIV